LIALLALLALVLGQAAAGMHAPKHGGSRGDNGAGTPSPHVQLCLECVSFAPLVGAHGSPVHVLALAVAATAGPLPAVEAAYAADRPATPFRARAPPR
jgi:hypothetical protein